MADTESAHCCDDMRQMLSSEDLPIAYWPCFREYGIRYLDGGTSIQLLVFCPWCGKRLPESLRHRWFEELDALGLDPPDDPRIPPEYLSDEWWRRSPETG